MSLDDRRQFEDMPDTRQVERQWAEIVALLNEADSALSMGDTRLADKNLDEALRWHKDTSLRLTRFEIYEKIGEEVIQSMEKALKGARRAAAKEYARGVKRADVVAKRQSLRQIQRGKPDLGDLAREWKKANKELVAAVDAFRAYEDGADLDVGLITRAINKASNISGFTMDSVDLAFRYQNSLAKEINLMYGELKRM